MKKALIFLVIVVALVTGLPVLAGIATLLAVRAAAQQSSTVGAEPVTAGDSRLSWPASAP